jgi:hypothetical protein
MNLVKSDTKTFLLLPFESTDDNSPQQDKTMPRRPRCQEKWQIFTDKWARCVILRIERPVVNLLVRLTKNAATYPKSYIAGIIVFSIVLLVSQAAVV